MPASSPERSDTAASAFALGAEETVAFVMSLRAKGVRDIRVLRAMEMVPRDLFAPGRFSDLARADVSLPLPCGQTMTAPGPIAAMLVALAVEPHHRVLEVGTGSGYLTAVLGKLGREVMSIERFRTLALAAAERVASLDLAEVRIATGDGLAVGRTFGAFDRIILNGTLTALPPGLLAALPEGGRLVGARQDHGFPRLVRVDRAGDGTLPETLGESLRLPPLVPGTAAAL
jgi:protein-L-isoaspartate(D-aspartate) O-methyltransferase